MILVMKMYNILSIEKILVDKCIELPYKGFRNIVTNKYFNKDYPENRNINFSNKNSPYVSVYNNGWHLERWSNIKNVIIDNTKDIMQKHYLDINTQKKISTGLISDIKPYEKFNEDENEIELGIELKRILLNNKNN